MRVAVGFSLGGNLLLKWLAELGHNSLDGVQRAMAVSTPIDLARCARCMQRRSRALYDRWFVRSLVSRLRQRVGDFPGLDPRHLAPPPRTLYEFDDRITAPMSGFSDAAEYYQRCSTALVLHAIRTPTVLLAAADDPLVPVEMYSAATLSDSVAMRITPHGGHVGFFGRGTHDPDWHWLDWRVVDFATDVEE
jgi:predicted alpha/beta-fold hydrolase